MSKSNINDEYKKIALTTELLDKIAEKDALLLEALHTNKLPRDVNDKIRDHIMSGGE